jgi:hypothetical protein
MYVRADRSVIQIANIANVATVDANFLPELIKLLNQHPLATRAAIIAFASALGTVRQS